MINGNGIFDQAGARGNICVGPTGEGFVSKGRRLDQFTSERPGGLRLIRYSISDERLAVGTIAGSAL